MAYVSTETRSEAGLVSNWFSGLISELKASAERYQAYRTTLDELNSMSDRELSDIGVSRTSIRDIARESVRLA